MISLIIPNYNKEKFIESTINCLKAQSFKEWECIIIDDNSTDKSLDIIYKLTDDDSRFKVIELKVNKGACYCRNQGIQKSTGGHIIFLDSDDFITKDCLKNRLQMFVSNKCLDFLVFPTGTFFTSPGDNSWVWNNFHGNHLNRFLAHDIPWVICSVIWKKTFLEKIGGFDESFVRLQDVDLHTRALLVENVRYHLYASHKPDSFYRIDNARISNYLIYLKNDIAGKIHFIETIKTYSSVKSKYLKGTFFECFKNIFVFHRKNQLNNSEFKKLKKYIMSNKFILKFNALDMTIIYMYIAVSNTKIYFRGFNRIFKLILIR